MSEKKSYGTPKLTVYGSVESITLSGGFGGHGDYRRGGGDRHRGDCRGGWKGSWGHGGGKCDGHDDFSSG